MSRSLRDNETIHHLDCNRRNNRKNNLIVLSLSDHARLHKWLERNNLTYKDFLGEKPSSCKNCDKTLQIEQKHFCSKECEKIFFSKNINEIKNEYKEYYKNSIKQRNSGKKPSKKDLLLLLTHYQNFTKLGKLLGVSDNAIKKWCKSFGMSHYIKDYKTQEIPLPKQRLNKFSKEEEKAIAKIYQPHHKKYGARALARELNVCHVTVLDIVKRNT